MIQEQTASAKNSVFARRNRGQKMAALVIKGHHMSSLLRAFARLAVFVLVLVSNALVFGQSTFTSQGGEYSLVGVQPGDQMQPQVAVSGAGGVVVWQERVWGWGAAPSQQC